MKIMKYILNQKLFVIYKYGLKIIVQSWLKTVDSYWIKNWYSLWFLLKQHWEKREFGLTCKILIKI